MTGFARKDGGNDQTSWSWEIKSVNGRGFDIRADLPRGFEHLEVLLKPRIRERCERGKLHVRLTVRQQAAFRFSINQEALQRLREALEAVSGDSAPWEPPRLDGLLALPGMIEQVDARDEAEAEDVESELLSDFDSVVSDLNDMRLREGEAILKATSALLDNFERCLEGAEALESTMPARLKQRIAEQVSQLLEAGATLSEERLAQELAAALSRSDVREELDRLRSHVDAIRALLAKGSPLGRQLDFLCQELNREANTLCSKSFDIQLTRYGLDMKGAIEQLREQAQNVE